MSNRYQAQLSLPTLLLPSIHLTLPMLTTLTQYDIKIADCFVCIQSASKSSHVGHICSHPSMNGCSSFLSQGGLVGLSAQYHKQRYTRHDHLSDHLCGLSDAHLPHKARSSQTSKASAGSEAQRLTLVSGSSPSVLFRSHYVCPYIAFSRDWETNSGSYIPFSTSRLTTMPDHHSLLA